MALFEKFLRDQRIFQNKDYLRPSYTPDKLLHREEQIEQLARILVAPLRGETPSNVLIYGKPGTGKTAVTLYLLRELQRERNHIPVVGVYVNCQHVNTEYRVLSRVTTSLLEEFRNRKGSYEFSKHNLPSRIPHTGWPVDLLFDIFKKVVDLEQKFVIIALDEIDKLTDKGDNLLYKLSRLNAELVQSKVSVVGISNNATFLDFLDPRVKSSLGEAQVVFPPYNAQQLQDILKERVKLSFKPGVVTEEAIKLCAALAAQEHGDARRALDLLRTAGEIAEERNEVLVKVEHVQEGNKRLQKNAVKEILATLPLQQKIVLLCLVVLKQNGCRLTFGEIYKYYQRLCEKNGITPVGHRSLKNYLDELDMLGIISTEVVSRGRGGRSTMVRDLLFPGIKKALLPELGKLEFPQPDSKLCSFFS